MVHRKAEYKIEVFDDRLGFIKFDSKKNEDDATRIAEVTAKSRKKWFRVVNQGKVIAEFDCRKKK